MKVRLRYFGMVSDRLGKQAEEVECDEVEAFDVRAWLLRLHPELAGMSWKVAVDQELVDGPCQIQESSEIVLLPPFAGG